MKYQNKLEKRNFKQNPASWAGCGPCPNGAAGLALRPPAKPTHSETASGPTQPSRLSAPTRRACPHRADAHGAHETAELPRGRRRPRCTGKTTPSTSTFTCTRRAPTQRRGAHETTRHRKRLRLTGGEVVLRVTMPPLLPVRRGNDRRGVA
jgi:hypothetical protein